MRKKKKAFTLIELIIVLAIMATILGSIYLFFLSNTRGLNSSEANVNLQDQAQNILDTMSKDFMEARKIDSIVNIDGTSYIDETYCDITSITIKPLDGYNITYYINDGVLTRSIVDESYSKDIGKYIESLIIESSDGKDFRETKALRIVVKLKFEKGNKDYKYETLSNVVFRNADAVD